MANIKIKNKYVSTSCDQYRIYGHGIIDFFTGTFYFEDGKRSKIDRKRLFLLSLLCEDEDGLSRDAAIKYLGANNYSFNDEDFNYLRGKLGDKEPPFKYICNKRGKFVIAKGTSDGRHITVSHICNAMQDMGLLINTEPEALIEPAILALFTKELLDTEVVSTKQQVSEFVNGNGIYISEALKTLYNTAQYETSFSNYWNEELTHLKDTFSDYDCNPDKNLAGVIKEIFKSFPMIRKEFFTGRNIDSLERSYGVLNALCHLAFYEASDFLAQIHPKGSKPDEELIKLREDYLKAILNKIPEIFGESPSRDIATCKGDNTIPKPSVYSNYWTRLFCDEFIAEEDDYSLSFDFEKLESMVKRPWVSLIYKFKDGVDVTGKKLKFILSFDKGNFSRIDVEIKRNQKTLYRKICEKTDDYEIDSDELPENVRKAMEEICFTVYADYASGMKLACGKFSVKNLRLENE